MKTLDNQSVKVGEPRTEANATTDELEEVPLSPWQEIIGECIDIHRDDENTSVTLRVNGQALRVIIPALSDSLLHQSIGKRVGILRTDDIERPFVVRKI